MKPLRGNAGMTLLEIVVAGTIFVVFASSFSAAWISTRKQVSYIINRARVLREAGTARACLSADLASALAVTTTTIAPNDFFIQMPDSSTVDYRFEPEGSLVRIRTYESSSTSMTVAKYLHSMNTGVDGSGSTSNFEFRISTNGVTASNSPAVNLYMRWNKVPAS